MAPSTSSLRGNRLPILPAFFAVLSAQFITGLLLVIMLLVLYPWQDARRTDYLLNVILAISFSQVILLAIWNALGEGKLVIRPIGSFICVIAVLGMTYGAIYLIHRSYIIGSTIALAMFVQWVMCQAPLWIARLSFGWRIGVIDHQNLAGGPWDVQFGIKHLIAWMTFVAVVLAIGKGLLRIESLRSRDAVGFGVFLVFNCLFTWPTVLGSLAERWTRVAMSVSFLLMIGVTMAEPFVFQKLAGGSRENVFWWLNGTEFVWIAGSMLIIRWFGFRLVRSRTDHKL